MDQPNEPIFQKAVELLKARDNAAARDLLIDYLRQHPESETGWLLLSYAVSGRQQRMDCLQRVLKVNPQNARARSELNKLAISKPSQGSSLRSALQKVESTSSQHADGEPVKHQTDPHLPAGKKMKRSPLLLLIGTVAALCVAGSVIGGVILGVNTYNEMQHLATMEAQLLFPTATPRFILPSTWTPTPTPPATRTPLPSHTPEPSATPTYPVVGPTAAAEISMIQQQVGVLRGLEVLNPDVPTFVMHRGYLEEVLQGLVINSDLLVELSTQRQVFSALGLIGPDYELEKYALNDMADGIGGFYVPWTKTIYVAGMAFSGMERWIYSHEFGHALVDQHYDLEGMGVYPKCEGDQQRCDAIQALVEGDANLVMYRWLIQYANEQDYRDLINYVPPRQLVPEQFPPPALMEDTAFAYEYGQLFVQYLFNRGKWEAVDRAYANLPETTEQIMHPEKYLAGERAIPVEPRSLNEALGAGWVLWDENSLGEWKTFLILGYSAEEGARIELEQAETAARGWGGDHYQLYLHPESGKNFLTVHWIWDSSLDAEQFNQALRMHLDQRFLNGQVDAGQGACWEANQQASCMVLYERETVLMVGASLEDLQSALSVYGEFH